MPNACAANLLRGAFGLALDSGEAASLFAPHRPDTFRDGVHVGQALSPANRPSGLAGENACPTKRSAGGPSGLADPPRPFVFRARHLDGLTVRPGEPFHFDLHVFTGRPEALDAIRRAFASAASAGIGPGRGRAEMHETAVEPVSLSLDPLPHAPPRIRVDFLSPTELKHHGRIVTEPDFAVLFARIRDRISALRELYGPGPLAVDFADIGARAAAVRMAACDWHPVEITRRSSRTGQSHGIGGFIGFAEYEGPLAEFLPYLEAARWTGVGRQAVWGKGEIAVTPLTRAAHAVPDCAAKRAKPGETRGER